MKIFNSSKLQLYKKALDVHSRQHEAIAKNVAHANDINFKRVKTDFSEELKVAVTQKLKTTDARHIQGAGVSENKLAMSGENESVDMNTEMGELAVNQIRFEFVTNVLRKAYRGLNTSITGRTS